MKIAALTVLFCFVAARAVALDPKDMTAWEADRWSQVKSDRKSAESFLVTRDYVRLCGRIVDGKASAKGLAQPKGFDKKHLAKGEAKIINGAVQRMLNGLVEEKAEADPDFKKDLPEMERALKERKK